MSATAPPSGVPLLIGIVAVAVCACALFLLGALVVEPALHRLIAPGDDPKARPGLGLIEVGDAVLEGRYATAGSTVVLQIDGGEISNGSGGRLTSMPHRLVQADQMASVTRVFSQAMNVPEQAQIEVRRVTNDDGTQLCAGHPVGWLALAIRRDGVVLMPVRQGPPPGALAPDDRLCDVLDLSR